MLSKFLSFTLCLSLGTTFPTEQIPILSDPVQESSHPHSLMTSGGKTLKGRFLHITDFHPDPFFRKYSSTEEEAACHRGEGPAGLYGAETTDCDSPISLVNATFRWITYNLRDTVDFVIWTGDSARHDSDEQIPRSEKQVLDLNDLMVTKFTEVFGKDDNINDTDPTNDFTIPIVPTFGNNDILPHNIFEPGPNKWTRKYTDVWRKFIPEEQRHSFTRGGWFFVEVIPNKLAVFSLNSLYFFDSNTAVDGCAERSEPGYEQMDWLRIQLQFLRQRGMKAILTGHVPPARTESKQSWDETCWQKYTLWMKQYRDVVVGSVYGHMNIDHFMLQDFEDISKKALKGKADSLSRLALDDELTIQSSADYLTELRSDWAQLPNPPKKSSTFHIQDLMERFKKKKPKKSREEKYFEKIGGSWAERYSLSLVAPSVVPNYFPTMRVVEYNISGIHNMGDVSKATAEKSQGSCRTHSEDHEKHDDDKSTSRKGREHKSKKPDFVMPDPPSTSAPPGPAYSPQSFSWLGYTQYYANLTRINDDFNEKREDVHGEKWHEGKHHGKKPKEESKTHHNEFKFEVEYNTRNDSVFNLKDLTVRSYVDLANRIGRYKPARNDRFEVEVDVDEGQTTTSCNEIDVRIQKNKKYKKHHGKKHKHRKSPNKVWFAFVNRAYVGTRDEGDLHDQFG